MFYKHVDSATGMDGSLGWQPGAGALCESICGATLASCWKAGAAGLQLGWPPAGQLCGTAAIVEQNSFLITHLASQFNRKYSSWIFFFFPLLELEGNQKREAYFLIERLTICRFGSWKCLSS